MLGALTDAYNWRPAKLQTLRAEQHRNSSGMKTVEAKETLRQRAGQQYCLRRRLIQQERELRKLRRLLVTSRRINRITDRAMIDSSTKFTPDLCAAANRKLPIERWKTEILLRAATRKGEEEVRPHQDEIESPAKAKLGAQDLQNDKRRAAAGRRC